MKTGIMQFWDDERGATAIEYSLIAVGIAMAIISAVHALGSQLTATYSGIANAMK